MQPAKPAITRTFGQIHFEDLDPKRFEDLVRQLIYDFKDWQSIEATGRGGADDGFDIRAYEKNYRTTEVLEESEEDSSLHPMNGELWMIQCKREQEIGPTRIKKIIAENINRTLPPYGYILAASANISKKTYDAFREELQQLGVMEFYLWGKASLEDMLFMPKNDRILFTFFGLSMTTQRRSRTTEMRASIIVKNKLQILLGTGTGLFKPLLLRDIKDESYPYEQDYRDFDAFPRWKTYTAIEEHPLGFVFQVQEYFAYIDVKKKEYDFTTFINSCDQEPEDYDEQQEQYKKRLAVVNFQESLPRARNADYYAVGLLKYKDMALVDAKGDSWNECIHIFTDFIKGSPFHKLHMHIKKNQEMIKIDDFKRVKIFPDQFKDHSFGKIHKDRSIPLIPEVFSRFGDRWNDTLYALDDRYSFLSQNDVIKVEKVENHPKETAPVEITCLFKMTMADYLEENSEDSNLSEKIKQQVGKVPTKKQLLWIYEIKKVYSYDLNED
jgi:hypothetical protein